ncbi:hypothetical protein [Bacillus cereus]|uniref:hypothetical protein n=2 Tax=Bacillus TaxID=1386 RepID=UPI000319D306|nr:hypothetical protein [Bacillus cereus]
MHIGNYEPEYLELAYDTPTDIKELGGMQADAVAALQKIREGLLDGNIKFTKVKGISR